MAIHPVQIKNTFARHLTMWALFLPLMTLIFLPVFVPNQTIDPAEVKMMRDLGVDVDKLTASANSTFEKMFINSGAMQKTEAIFKPQYGSDIHIKSSYPAQWMHGIWLILYKFIWRIHALWFVFLLPLLAICIPAVIDGVAARSKKNFSFQRANPLFFYTSTHAATLVLGLCIFLPLVPLTLTTAILSGMLVAMAVAVWIATSNFQTGG